MKTSATKRTKKKNKHLTVGFKELESISGANKNKKDRTDQLDSR